METIRIGIIGGSGLYKMEGLEVIEEVNLDTPFGKPSDNLIVGNLDGVKVAFLPRHGRNHHLLPSEVPFRANIYALKTLGVEYIISASAVGSLKQEIKPLDLVIPDQFIDRTKNRPSTFFGDGIVAHVAFGNPVCGQLSKILAQAVRNLNFPDISLHEGGTYVCIEGPAFSTIAESNLYRSWGGSVIGMTNLTEAKLAREAEIAYATLALVTDYDCWNPEYEHVTVETVIENLHRNATNAQKIIRETVKLLHQNPFVSVAHSALKNAIVTPPDAIPPATLERLHLLLKKYL
ncbi:MAG: S-methyl-5'-thioadenosine phosphorylase [Geminocystis sp.]|nr:S-methyl-5'-thioadenosine phosphorylase [Geminocystis sp.]MCX8077993.1 S-methyl-5'-thioadenosine phosphorylase [Geminocystis sp.]MDW8115283.1 S-methyl-5'-thioadenosine phosphorylase [Geminocystis sp.]HIK36472.1 S-methyl-5'-thioadenosine phosphorylase [Geminocystis sp. M7585_C2015_104]